jgi:hypothetical protein
MHRALRHLRANVIAYVALFVALGGTSYAAVSLPKNSVGTKQLKTGAVHRSDIASNAVSGSKVAANTLKGADIDEASLGKVPSATSADSSTSAASATNATNATNAADAAKLGGLAPSAFQRGVRWALINNAGTAIVAQSGGITIFSHPFPGETFVDFGSPTAGHPVWAMNSDLDNLATQGAATAGPCGVAADAYPNCAFAIHANRVHVATHNAAGTLADRSFYVYLLP